MNSGRGYQKLTTWKCS